MSKNTTSSPKKTPNTTVAIDPQTTDRLNTFCQKYGITKKDYISMSLDFFEKTGLSPEDVDKVIFQRVMEKQMEVFQDKLNTLDQRTEQSNTIISNVHGMVMGSVQQSILSLLDKTIQERSNVDNDRERNDKLLLEWAEKDNKLEEDRRLFEEERQKFEEERQRFEEGKSKKKKGWFRRNKD